MLLAYADESGSPGSGASFTLACTVIDADKWPTAFDNVIGYRRFLRDTFRIPMRAELKANYLLRNGGPLRKIKPALSEDARFRIYRGLMQLHAKVGLRTFAIVINQEPLRNRGRNENPRDVAWEYAIQRLERMMEDEKTPLMLIHDEGEEDRIRALARKARRAGTAGSAFGTGSLKVPARRLIDDPVPRDSRQSYFVQLADLAAYAAFRRVYAPTDVPGRTTIVPQKMWDELGDARHAPANSGREPLAIVVWPK